MGDRPLINPEDVESSISNGGGQLVADRRIKRVPMTAKKEIEFSEWESIEVEYLARLRGREPLLRNSRRRSVPTAQGKQLGQASQEFIGARDGSQFGVAMAWVGDMISRSRTVEARVHLRVHGRQRSIQRRRAHPSRGRAVMCLVTG